MHVITMGVEENVEIYKAQGVGGTDGGGGGYSGGVREGDREGVSMQNASQPKHMDKRSWHTKTCKDTCLGPCPTSKELLV